MFFTEIPESQLLPAFDHPVAQAQAVDIVVLDLRGPVGARFQHADEDFHAALGSRPADLGEQVAVVVFHARFRRLVAHDRIFKSRFVVVNPGHTQVALAEIAGRGAVIMRQYAQRLPVDALVSDGRPGVS